MKKVLVAAFSMILVGTTVTAQITDMDSDDDLMNDKIGMQGTSSRPARSAANADWCSLTTIALSPFQYSENGVGVGLSYERALDHQGIISVYVPAIATFNVRDRRNYNYGYNYSDDYRTNIMTYLMPGVKIYPTGMGRVKYAVGPNMVVGYGQKTLDNALYDPIYGYYGYGGTYDRFILGMMVNNSLNIMATPHLYIGAEMGFGFTYLDRVSDINYGTRFLTQGCFKIGYTF